MKMLVISILILLMCNQTAHAQVIGQGKIMGGQFAEEGQFPYQVLVRTEHYLCGGAIIDPRWILTAAHCNTNGDVADIVVHVGTLYTTGEGGVGYKAKEFIPHEDFEIGTAGTQNDIALIRLGDDIEFGDNVGKIGLPKIDINEYGRGLPVVISGYGVTKPAPPDNPIRELKYAIVKIESQSWCRMQWSAVTSRHICTRIGGGGGQSSCVGDSGGPVVMHQSIIGIISYGDGRCGTVLPNVNTRVYSYLPWIREKMNS